MIRTQSEISGYAIHATDGLVGTVSDFLFEATSNYVKPPIRFSPISNFKKGGNHRPIAGVGIVDPTVVSTLGRNGTDCSKVLIW
jgi:hypothetical protein